MVELTKAEFEAATARGEARMRGPRAASAHYDAGRNRIIVRLTTGVEIGFAPRDVEGPRGASAKDLKAMEVEAFGLGIHFPTLDADLYVPALLEGVLGSKSWMAAELGAAGGRTRTAAKAMASRENGKRGGRPRKKSRCQRLVGSSPSPRSSPSGRRHKDWPEIPTWRGAVPRFRRPIPSEGG
jgi:hypothetical protein